MVVLSTTLLLLAGPTHEYGDGWWSEGVTAVVEALLVAGILGLTVDRLLKLALVRDVARLSMQAIFGVNAPQEYIGGLQAKLQAVAMVHVRVRFTLSFEWHEPGVALKVTGKYVFDSVNVSSGPWNHPKPWVIGSMAGQAASHFEMMRVEVRGHSAGQRADVIETQEFDRQELARAAIRRPDGSCQIVTAQLSFPEAPPGPIDLKRRGRLPISPPWAAFHSYCLAHAWRLPSG
ncbi:MAG TPA: hypothetical protein VGD67_08235 [Pseudonocardiaceae bacterium]